MDKHKPTGHDWVIVGAGGFARELAWQIECHDANGGILMAVEPEHLPDPPEVGMYEVTTIQDALDRSQPWTMWILGVGDVALRKRLAAMVEEAVKPVEWGIVKSACAVLATDISTSPGAYIGPGCVVSVGCFFGAHALVNQQCSIGHDCTIGEHAVICPGCVLSGGVTIGAGTFLGSGVTVLPKVRIGAGAQVTAGTTVGHTVPPHSLRYEARDLRTMPKLDD